jgi:two-component system, NarL family, invasion response regulator UvrY
MKLLVVDDHPIVRSGLRRLLGGEPNLEIIEAANGADALAAFKEQRPDLVILDLNLPGISGLEVLGRLRVENPKVRVLAVSMHDNPLYVTRALEAGACGYVSKSAPPEQLLAAVRRVAAGQAYIEHEIAQELALWNIRAPAHPLKQLSPRDLEILRLLADGSSLTEIAQAIGISYKTVANHCTQLKAKLATPRMADLIRLAISSGLSADDRGLAGTLPVDRAP